MKGMTTKPLQAYSLKFNQALSLAAIAHRQQKRKGSQAPYIIHPVGVAVILMRHGFSEELQLAGLLHDVVEDCNVTLAEITFAFGPEVSRLVAAVSEKKMDIGTADGEAAPRPWKVRKEEDLAHLAAGDHLVAALKAADALHNVHSTLEALATEGPDAWKRFKAPAPEQRWYYQEIARMAGQKLGDHALAVELAAAVAGLGE